MRERESLKRGGGGAARRGIGQFPASSCLVDPLVGGAWSGIYDGQSRRKRVLLQLSVRVYVPLSVHPFNLSLL